MRTTSRSARACVAVMSLACLSLAWLSCSEDLAPVPPGSPDESVLSLAEDAEWSASALPDDEDVNRDTVLQSENSNNHFTYTVHLADTLFVATDVYADHGVADSPDNAEDPSLRADLKLAPDGAGEGVTQAIPGRPRPAGALLGGQGRVRFNPVT
jgi:hypothetical protein